MFPYPGHMKKTNHSVYEVCFTGILDHQLYTNLIQSFRHLCFDLIDIFSIYELTLILKNIGQCYVKHIITIIIKTITSVFKVSTYIATIGINSSYQTCCQYQSQFVDAENINEIKAQMSKLLNKVCIKLVIQNSSKTNLIYRMVGFFHVTRIREHFWHTCRKRISTQ
jgi:hypothetical protein